MRRGTQFGVVGVLSLVAVVSGLVLAMPSTAVGLVLGLAMLFVSVEGGLVVGVVLLLMGKRGSGRQLRPTTWVAVFAIIALACVAAAVIASTSDAARRGLPFAAAALPFALLLITLPSAVRGPQADEPA